MYEQDYIMRLVREIVRMILKLFFNIDTDNPTIELLEDLEAKSVLEDLIEMIEKGEINEAENYIYEITSDRDRMNLKIALLFYSYLNEKEDIFLIQHGFSREEVQSGINDLISKYGLSEVSKLYCENVSRET